MQNLQLPCFLQFTDNELRNMTVAQMRDAFAIAEKKFLTSLNANPPKTADELFWAFTNPIWII